VDESNLGDQVEDGNSLPPGPGPRELSPPQHARSLSTLVLSPPENLRR